MLTNTLGARLAHLFSWVALACAGCIISHGTWAADLAALSGTFQYVPEQSNDVAEAIDAAVAKMNFIKRPIARNRLAKTNTPYQRIRIQMSAAEVEITYDDRKPLRMPIDGAPIKWTRDDGEVFDVSAKVDGGALLQTYQAEDGMRVNAFRRASDGSLHLKVEVSSPQLPRPMSYELVYQAL